MIEEINTKACADQIPCVIVVFIYYSGHGVQDGYTCGVFNQLPFTIENSIVMTQDISEYIGFEENTISILLQHSCRAKSPIALNEIPRSMSTNFVGIFGCPPYGSISQSSMIGTTLFKHWRMHTDRRNGEFVFPNMQLMQWRPGTYGTAQTKDEHGDVLISLKFPVILTDKAIKQALEDDCIAIDDQHTDSNG